MLKHGSQIGANRRFYPKFKGGGTRNCRKVPKCCLKHYLNLFWRIRTGFWNSAHLHSNLWVDFGVFFHFATKKAHFCLIFLQTPTFKFLAIMDQSITSRVVYHIWRDVTNQAITQTWFKKIIWNFFVLQTAKNHIYSNHRRKCEKKVKLNMPRPAKPVLTHY